MSLLELIVPARTFL